MELECRPDHAGHGHQQDAGGRPAAEPAHEHRAVRGVRIAELDEHAGEAAEPGRDRERMQPLEPDVEARQRDGPGVAGGGIGQQRERREHGRHQGRGSRRAPRPECSRQQRAGEEDRHQAQERVRPEGRPRDIGEGDARVRHGREQDTHGADQGHQPGDGSEPQEATAAAAHEELAGQQHPQQQDEPEVHRRPGEHGARRDLRGAAGRGR